MTKFNDIKVGQSAKVIHKITTDDIRKFADLTGDDNRIHTDPEFAASTYLKKPVAHGMLGASFISTVIGTKLPGDGALWFSQSLEFCQPVRVDDTLTIFAEVLKKDDRTKVIELKTEIVNQHRQRVTYGIAKVKVTEQENSRQASESKRSNDIALVIGATGGIGAAVSVMLAKEGFKVVIAYNKNEQRAVSLRETINENGGNAWIGQCDVRNRDSVFELVETVTKRYGAIDAVVNCSTEKIVPTKILELVWDDFQMHFDNQIRGLLNIVQAGVPSMAKARYGKIISLDTQYVDAPEPNLSAYIAAKGASRALSKSLAFDLAPKGINVNMVSPGITDTEQIADVPERVRLLNAAKTPLMRLATPEDVAKAVTFLATSQSNFICGEIIRVNGGRVMI
jgi:3-oxoacyl-[acyl-carrier protein] reductase